MKRDHNRPISITEMDTGFVLDHDYALAEREVDLLLQGGLLTIDEKCLLSGNKNWIRARKSY